MESSSQASAAITSITVKCPCCTFLPDDLFLPSSSNVEEDGAQTSSFDTTMNKKLVAPQQAWQRLKAANNYRPAIVDTHGHPHLEHTTDSTIYQTDYLGESRSANSNNDISSLCCAVSPQDWNICLNYAAQSPHRIPALGVHPWYLQDLLSSKSNWLQDLEQLLIEHERCLVGEIGLCKQARFLRTHPDKQQAIQLQRSVFRQQLDLAAKYQRAVSVHCVNQHGVLLDILRELTDLPAAMALHSFSGTAHHIDKLLQWEDSLRKQGRLVTNSPFLYFGFSHSVNYTMCSSDKARRQSVDAIRRVPRDRLLVESDVSCSKDVVGGTAGAIAYLAWALGDGQGTPSLESIAELTSQNALRFFEQRAVWQR